MERYALARRLQRQRQFARRMPPGHPLIAYVAQHRLLPNAMGLMAEPSMPLSRHYVPDEGARIVQSEDAVLPSVEQPVLNTEEGEFAAPSVEQPVLNTAESGPVAPSVQDTEQRQAQKMTKNGHTMPEFVSTQHTVPSIHTPAHVEKMVNPIIADATSTKEEDGVGEQSQGQKLQIAEDVVEKQVQEPEMQIEGDVAGELVQGLEQHIEEAAAVSLPVSTEGELLDAPVTEESHLAQQEGNRRTNQQGRPGKRRGRIEEQPALPTNASPAQRKLSTAEVVQKPEISRPVAKKTEAQRNAEGEAAELFTSNTPGRSPQEWFALLMQAEQKQQPKALAQPAHDPGHEQSQVQTNSAFQSAQLPSYLGHQSQPAQRSPEILAHNRATSAQPASYSGHRAQAIQHNPEMPAHNQATSIPSPASLSEGVPAARPVSAPQQATRGKSEESDRSPAPDDATVAEPISMRARRFLKPMLNFDPAGVRIHRGPAAARFTSAQQADAVTVGDDIFLGAGHGNDEPETLGLLAHELTHVARHHEPRFIPPVIDGRRHSATAVQVKSTVAHDEAVSASGASSTSSDEEALAEQVEHQVTRRAREETVSSAHASPARATHSVAPSNEVIGGAEALAKVPQQPLAAQTSWGGLPAPWEPLPDWLVSSPPTPANATDAFAAQPGAGQPLSSHAGNSASGRESTPGMTTGSASTNVRGGQHAAPAPVVQRAGLERSRALTTEQAGQQEQPLQPQREPEPDLDKLARQVYAVLKRRLAVERRRLS